MWSTSIMRQAVYLDRETIHDSSSFQHEQGQTETPNLARNHRNLEPKGFYFESKGTGG